MCYLSANNYLFITQGNEERQGGRERERERERERGRERESALKELRLRLVAMET